jgi:hypothetical protein
MNRTIFHPLAVIGAVASISCAIRAFDSPDGRGVVPRSKNDTESPSVPYGGAD